MTGFFAKQSHRKILLQSSVFYIVKDRFSALLILKGFNFLFLAFQEMTQALGQGQDFACCPRRREIQTEKGGDLCSCLLIAAAFYIKLSLDEQK